MRRQKARVSRTSHSKAVSSMRALPDAVVIRASFAQAKAHLALARHMLRLPQNKMTQLSRMIPELNWHPNPFLSKDTGEPLI